MGVLTQDIGLERLTKSKDQEIARMKEEIEQLKPKVAAASKLKSENKTLQARVTELEDINKELSKDLEEWNKSSTAAEQADQASAALQRQKERVLDNSFNKLQVLNLLPGR